VFSIGLAAYWPQFPGLKERLEGYGRQVEARVGDWADVVSAGLVDDADGARAAGDLFAREGVDLILLHTATYATSSQVLPAVQRAGVPVVVLNVQPVAALDYPNTDTGEWLANCSACCAPELAGAFARARVPYQVLSGLLDGADDSRAWREIGAWCQAAGAVRALRGARFQDGVPHAGVARDLYPLVHVEGIRGVQRRRLVAPGQLVAVERAHAEVDEHTVAQGLPGVQAIQAQALRALGGRMHRMRHATLSLSIHL
jgi:hypothetical protein